MSNTLGTLLKVTLFGESHGPCIGAVADGLPAGIPVDEDAIRLALARRRPRAPGETGRREPDRFFIESGVYHAKTCGSPLCIRIENADVKSEDYADLSGVARPGHCDYTSFCRYEGFEDPRGGGHLSGRLTAPLVAIGAIVENALAEKNVEIATRIFRCGSVEDGPWRNFAEDRKHLRNGEFPALTAEEEMQKAILRAAEENDSIGGVLETVITGLPAGVGEPWFDCVESVLARGLFAIPAVKAVEFGDGFSLAEKKGSEVNDAYRTDGEKIYTATNHQGGIAGGLTNGMPLCFRCGVKPTPSIGKEQQTVDFLHRENRELKIAGRHDACILPRAVPVADAVTALCLGDLMLQRFGPGGLR